LPKLWSFNTFFYNKLVKDRYKSVQRWTKQLPGNGIFDHDLIIIPVHTQNRTHWCCGAINFESKRLEWYDSMGALSSTGTAESFFMDMRLYMEEEAKRLKLPPIDWTGWENYTGVGIPQQENHCDCGVFTTRYAEYLSRRAPFTFSQREMPYLRRRTALEILTQQLLPHPAV